jgi:hypothetical protein
MNDNSYRILFPCQSYNLKQVDEAFEVEANTCKLIGIEYYLFDYDFFVETGGFKTTINIQDYYTLIYRGWMLKPLQYKGLAEYVVAKSNFQVTLINNSWEYDSCHCFPNVYGLVKRYTPRIQELPNWGDVYTTDLKFDFFIKDHVKSIKTIDGVEKLDKNLYMTFKDELVDKIAQFVKERGKLFTGNIVLKEFVDLKKIKGKTNEWRAFYFNGEFLTCFQNSYLKTTEQPPLKLINEVGECLHQRSNFFTVDFALTESNHWIVIETGDGQVSGLPDGSELSFYNTLLNKL